MSEYVQEISAENYIHGNRSVATKNKIPQEEHYFCCSTKNKCNKQKKISTVDNNLNALVNIQNDVSTPTELQVWEQSSEVQCLPSVLKTLRSGTGPTTPLPPPSPVQLLLCYWLINKGTRLLLYSLVEELILKIFAIPM